MTPTAMPARQNPVAASRCQRCTFAAGVTLAGEPEPQVVLEVHWPESSTACPSLAFVCIPGGGMTRRYFDLAADQDDSFSFARQMTARGYVVLLVDSLGVGESTRPQDGYVLTPDLLAQANAHAIDQALAGLRDGTLVSGLAALPALRSIGLGHSMGAMLTVIQQAQYRGHAGVALLGFGTCGLPEYLPAEAQLLTQQDRAALHARLPELARALFAASYPDVKPATQGNSIYGGAGADRRGVEALKAVRGPLLPIPAYLSMLPGNVAAEAAAIDVPVFLGLGERDLAGPPHQIPAAFTASHDVTLHVVPQAGHSHFLFASRHGLFDRLAAWARDVVQNSQDSNRKAGEIET